MTVKNTEEDRVGNKRKTEGEIARATNTDDDFRNVQLAFWELRYNLSMLIAVFWRNQTRLDTMRDVDNQFFDWVIRVTHDSILLRIARLTDTPQTGRHTNISIRALQNSLSSEIDSARQAKIDICWDRVKNPLEIIRIHRNRRIAHFSPECGVGQEQLPDLPTRDVLCVVNQLRRIMDELGAVVKPHTHIDWSVGGYDNGRRLFKILDLGLREWKNRKQRYIETGRWTE